MNQPIDVNIKASAADGVASYEVTMSYAGKQKVISNSSSGKSSANAALLAGAATALRKIKKPSLPVVIHTTSKYLQGAITGNMGGKANEALRQTLSEAVKGYAGEISVES